MLSDTIGPTLTRIDPLAQDLGTTSSTDTSSSPGSSPPPSVVSSPGQPHSRSSPPRAGSGSSHSHRISSLGGLHQLSSSPLSSATSAKHRRRQSSFSSSVSNTTDATSYDGSGEECASLDGLGEKDAAVAAPGSSFSSSASSRTSTRRNLGADPTPTGAPPSGQFLLTGSAPHAISIPPSSSLPLTIATSIPSASVRLSTTPLFPSPLAQASGPDEEHDPRRSDDGDAASGDDDDERLQSEPAWSGKSPTSHRGSTDLSAPFGDLELSPPRKIQQLPEVDGSDLEQSLTPRPPPVVPRQRHQPISPTESDPARSARSPRVRSLGRASGLSHALSIADDVSSNVNRRSRVDSSGSGSSARTGSQSNTPTKVGMHSSSSVSSMSTSPPSPSASTTLSVSPSTVSRRASLNLASPPRFFQPGSPTGASRNLPRTSMTFTSALPIPIPAPFPAAPPPSESIKLQRVPESVRSAVDFRQSPLSSSYSGESFGSLVGTAARPFHPGSPLDVKVPRTPTATRAPSPASASGASSPSDGRSAPVTRPHSREGTKRVSRQSSREQMSAFSGGSGGSPATTTTPSTPATSAFSPLFPFQASSPGMTRSRSKSMSQSGPPKSLRHDLFRSSMVQDDIVSPRSAAQQGLGVTPSFFLGEPSTSAGASLHPRTASDSHSSSTAHKGHRATASSSSMTGPASRLAGQRLSIAPTGSADSTDEYAQIILSTRNAKVRKWRPASPALDSGAAGPKSWGLAGGRNNSILGEQTEDGGDEGDQAETGWTGGAAPKEIEWVDWLDEYRKMKEAKLRADNAAKEATGALETADVSQDGPDESLQVVESERGVRKESSPTRSDKSTDRKSDSSRMAEPALATAQKAKAKATTTEFNPFEATTASMNRRDLEPRPFLTPGVSFSSPYFPLTATSASAATSPALFHPATTATPLLPTEPYNYSFIKPSTSHSTSGSSYVGSPGVKRKRNFAKLGHKIDAWWSAVRTSFSGVDDDRIPRHRRTSIDQPHSSLMPQAIEPSISRTSSQYVRGSTPGTPGLRNVASAQDLVRVVSTPSPSFSSAMVPRGALAPAARSDSLGRLRPPPERQRTLSSGSERDSETGASKSRRNPNLSLNLGPSFHTMVGQGRQSEQARLSNKVSPYAIPSKSDNMELSPPIADTPAGPRSAPENVAHAVPIPQASSDAPGFATSGSPVWDRTPALVPNAAHFPVRVRQVTMPNKLPSEQSAKAQEKDKRPEFSMHTVRSQIRQRLASAKESCDHELRRIIEGISTFVEKDLQQDLGTPMPLSGFDEGRFGELVQDDLAGGYTSSPDVESDGEVLVDTDQVDSDGGGSGTRRPPSRLKRALLSPGADGLVGSSSRSFDASTSGSGSPRRASLVPRHRHLTSVPRDGSASRSKTGSNSSSRSNSRSRSPLPPGLRRSSGQRSPATAFLHSANSKLAESAFIVLLQEIITIATEIIDTPISKLTALPGSCAEYIGKVQQIGEGWNENPELPCRGWYVQLLLAVAGLSRVVEWWEAEKGFWSFDDGDNEDAEPILFISKGGHVDESPEIRARGDSVSVPSLAPPAGAQPPHWSPLGIDLGAPDESIDTRSTRSRAPTASAGPDDTRHRAEELKQAVEAITSQTLLMELSLDGQLFQYLSSAWQDIVGVDPDECIDSAISDWLFPDDAAVFAEATRQLEADDSHTVEVSFRLRVASSSQTSQDDASASEDLYEAMEGKGMLMLDGLSGSASHTMWVIRPAPFSETAAQTHQSLARFGLDTFHRRSSSDPGMFLVPGRRINLEPILCRICERPTPAWFFEKHNETCNEVHRLEGDIGDCNDRLKDLLRALGELVIATDSAHPADEHAPEYRGIPLELSPPPSPSTINEKETKHSSPKLRHGTQHHVFDRVREIVETALSISTPSITDESCEIPIQEQRLLSPHSESNLATILHWQRPQVDDPALLRLLSDTEEAIRFKLNSVNRLRNTILYAEKVRQEWETKASEAIFATQEADQAEQTSTLPFDSPLLQPLTPQDDDLPAGAEHLELPRPTQTLRRQVSQSQGLLSPMLLAADDANTQLSSSPSAQLALSPRLPSAVPSSRTRASSIKDFKILKPISKGAFGSVYLAKKVTTGDYYAIKVLKKSDMVAKNQVTNVKAERMILMSTAESNFVVKLYYTFQSKDYLYLVMEYLNGGDCGALVKNLGGLTEDWAKKYVAEVVVGLEHLHSSGIIHRDLKPDNLLIDAKGHLKLTDFGLSRIGLLGRQTQLPASRDGAAHGRRPLAAARTSSNNKDFSTTSSPLSTPALGQALQSSYFGNVPLTDSFSLDTPSDSSISGSRGNTLSPTWQSGHHRPQVAADPLGAGAGPTKQHFVGTPDYLAPESILGIGMDACVDWWALGVICYEFIYGFPPFHDETPEKVFENILSRRFDWHEGEIDITPEARDFIDRLLCTDARRRLGARGAEEVKAHPFLEGVDWDNLLKGPVEFVPNVTDPESTDYFDARGAQNQTFNDDEPDPSVAEDPAVRQAQGPTPASTPGPGRGPRDRSETAPNPHDDFGTFSFRNLTVLKQANDDMIRKMKDEQLLPPLNNPLSIPIKGHDRSRNNSVDFRDPVSPSSTSLPGSSQTYKHSDSTSSSPLGRNVPDSGFADRSRSRQPVVGFHPRAPHHVRRNSMPSRLRKSSITSPPTSDEKEELRDEVHEAALTESWAAHSRRTSRQNSNNSSSTSPLASPNRDPRSLAPLQLPSPQEPEARSAPAGDLPDGFTDRLPPRSHLATIDCLVAGRNPIVTKVLETMLQRLGCRVVVVPNGAEAILAAGGIPFDVLFLDIKMAVVDGEKAARMIKSTVNPSAQAPIVAVCSHPAAIDDAAGTLFTATLSKPIMKADLLHVLSYLGFKLETKGDVLRRGSEGDTAATAILDEQPPRRGST